MRRGARLVSAVTAALLTTCGLMCGSAAAIATAETPAPSPSTAKSPTPTPTPTPDPIRSSQYWIEELGIDKAWETTKGKGTTIAVIDSGVASNIEELEGAIVGGADFSGVGGTDGRTPLGADAHTRSHGSWVASLAAARGTSEDAGMIGVAPEAELLSVSIGFGSVSDVPFGDQVAQAMTWSVDQGADVINLSFTTQQIAWDESWDGAFQYAFDHDVVVVVAAGNRDGGSSMIGAPATIPEVLVVGGVDEDGKASRGASTQGGTIAVSAPSESLIGIGPSGDVESWRGTSGSAPIVAGIAALVRAAHPDLDANNVINRIVTSTSPAPDQLGHRDPIYGFGIVDAEAAVTSDAALVSSSPVSDVSLKEWVRINRGAEEPGEVDSGPTPTPEPVNLPALPPLDPPAEAANPYLPSSESLREVTLPLMAGTAAGILILLGVVAVSRRFRSDRNSHGSSS